MLAQVEEPTPWVSSLAIATKKSGALGICIDPKHLNAVLKRETYQLPILDDMLPELAQAKVFSTVDLKAGYWHCVLDKESSLLTTFSTPYRRYWWLRLPFGLSVSFEIFQKRVNQALEGLEGILDITDDILIYGVGKDLKEATEDHDRHLKALLQRCRERGMALNKDKLKLRRQEVAFMGHLFTNNGLKIDPDKARTVQEMTPPTDTEGVQRLNGFVNYLSKFLPQLADVMEPLRRLTRKDTEWTWSEEQDKAFSEVKRLVWQAPVLSYYQPDRPLSIQCDASQKGLGAALLQDGRPIAYASRPLSDTEQRYAQIEKEMLAIVFALEKFNQYTFGRHVRVSSDHKPLESILSKPLAVAPRRLQGMMMRLQKYTFEVTYERGKNMHLADTLSRVYLPTEGNLQDREFEYINMASYLPIAEERLEEIRRETRNDPSLQELKCVITLGWPEDKSKVAPQVHPFFSIRDELTIQDGLIFRGQRVVVPQSLRPMIKTKLHSSHMGIDACLRRARESVFWPGFSAEIKQMVETCETCRKFETSPQKEPLVSHDVPLRPWEKIGVDIFELNGKEYLTTVDYYSNFWEIDQLPTDAKATTVIAKLKDHFACYGIPDHVVTDNGPQFKSQEFANFAAAYEFEHTPTSPYNNKGNGKVESAVKTAKRLLRKATDAGTDPYLSILDHRNTPTQGMESSPAQRLMNRRTKTLLPTTREPLKPRSVVPDTEITALWKRQEKQAQHYNKSAKELEPLATGDVVRMKPFVAGKKTWEKAMVKEQVDETLYTVETANGDTYRRNRFHMRKTKESMDNTSAPVEQPQGQTSPLPDTLQLRSREIQRATENAVQQAETPGAIPDGVQHKAIPDHTSTRPRRVTKPPAWLKDYVH